MSRVVLPESRLRARRRRRRIIIVSCLVALLLAFVGSLALLSWAPFMRITTVAVSGASNPGELEQAVRADLSGGYAHLFARSNIFLYPKAQIRQDLLKRFPTIKTLDVHAVDFHTVAVDVTERQPVALWCGEALESATQCSFLDEDGLAYAPAADYSGDAYQKYYGPLGSGHFLTQEHFRPLPALVAALQKAAGAGSVVAVAVDQSGDVRLTFDSGFALLFSGADDGGSVTAHFALALQSDIFKNHKLADFEYLDLRFGDRLYYKLRGSSQ